jgi:putative addiction module component (TIGR02574 family)
VGALRRGIAGYSSCSVQDRQQPALAIVEDRGDDARDLRPDPLAWTHPRAGFARPPRCLSRLCKPRLVMVFDPRPSNLPTWLARTTPRGNNGAMNVITMEEIKKLSVSERLELLEKVWDSLAGTPDALPLTDAQKVEMDRRLQHLEQNPDSVESSEQVKAYVRDPKRPR